MTDPFVEGISCYNAKEICKFFDYRILKAPKVLFQAFFFTLIHPHNNKPTY